MRAMRTGMVRDPDMTDDVALANSRDILCRRRAREWHEVAAEFQSRTGERITPERARRIADGAIAKLKRRW